jgi:hypothetical protein
VSQTAYAGGWLSGAKAGDGGLVLPGYPAYRFVADLVLGADQVVVRGRTASAALDWDECTAQHRLTRPQDDWWMVGPWRTRGSDLISIHFIVRGRYVELTEPVRAGPTSWRTLAPAAMGQAAIPLFSSGGTRLYRRMPEAQWATVDVLCALLADTPELRERLRDPLRVARLAADMAAGPLPPNPLVRMGARRSTTEVLSALRNLDYPHRYGGRPLPGDALPPLDDMVEQVMAHLRSSLYAAGVSVDPRHARDVIQRLYLEVQPWPFGALV